MSTIKPSNPSAFPLEYADGDFQRGMSLRDYFAAKAMQGFISNELVMQSIADNHPDEGDEYIAKECYRIADAMLKQREQ
jgi:hypothetical protein